MRMFIIIDHPMNDQQTADALAGGVTSPRMPLDGSSKAIIGFDGPIPDSFSDYTPLCEEALQTYIGVWPWRHPGFL